MVAQNRVPGLEKTVESLATLGWPVLVGVLGDGDWETPEGWTQVRFKADADLSWVRNELQRRAGTEWHLRLEPGEFFVGGDDALPDLLDGDGRSFSTLRGDLIVREARLWRGERPFRNPAYETQGLDLPPAPVYVYSPGFPSVDVGKRLEKWSQRSPSDPDPVYYKAFDRLARRDHDGFRRLAQEYLFLCPRATESTVMMRYYLASVQAAKRQYREALANLAVCLLHRPCMAEFWCLAGDIYMTNSRFPEASQFYRDALQAGAMRAGDDLWPMLISKYGDYPRDMIGRCERAASSAVALGAGSPRD